MAGSISLVRLVGAIVFAAIAFQAVPLVLVGCVYGIAMGSDLIDGFLARRWKAESYFGRVVDLVSDKSLTIVSLLYAASRRVDVFPLALIATREVVMIGGRLIIVNGKQLFPTNRIFGGIMAFLLWVTTLFMVITRDDATYSSVENKMYWGCAIVLSMNLAARVYTSRHRLRAYLSDVAGDRPSG